MDDVVPVAVVHSCQDLPELFPCLSLAHPSTGRQVVCRESIGMRMRVGQYTHTPKFIKLYMCKLALYGCVVYVHF